MHKLHTVTIMVYGSTNVDHGSMIILNPSSTCLSISSSNQFIHHVHWMRILTVLGGVNKPKETDPNDLLNDSNHSMITLLPLHVDDK